MLAKPIYKGHGFETAFWLLGSRSIKKMKKREGKQAQHIASQYKKVKLMTNSFFKEFLRRGKPELTNAEFRSWKEMFDQGVKIAAETIRKQASQHRFPKH
jgi:hypothetical protein